MAGKRWCFSLVIWLVIFLSFFSLLPGCAVRVGGPERWEENTLRQGINIYYADVHTVVLEILRAKGLPVEEDREITSTFPGAWITRTRLSGEPVTIEVQSLKEYGMEGSMHDLRPQGMEDPGYWTEISIRVGAHGNRAKSREILQWINNRLAQSPTP